LLPSLNIHIGEMLAKGQKALDECNIDTARLDTLVLMEEILKKDKAWILSHPEKQLEQKDIKKLNYLFAERSKHIPVAYLISHVEFYGRTFKINPHVLVPRPESEAIIDVLKEITTQDQWPNLSKKSSSVLKIADIGTGSGSLGTTNTQIDLIDVDAYALNVAKTNVVLFTLKLKIIKSDLLAKAPNNYDILLCNLPYVPDKYPINLAAQHEPVIAIYGGLDGLDLYRKLFKQIEIREFKPLYILTESMPSQHSTLAKIAKDSRYKLTKSVGYIQVFRLL
jgi:release factor glutamine methyltransferase